MKAIVTKVLLLLIPVAVFTGQAEEPDYSPYANVSYPTEVFWGDTHLHTTNSLDARSLGVTLDVEQAYRLARGDQVTTSTGLQAQLAEPLDFLVVTDHSDLMGIVDQLMRENPKLMQQEERYDAKFYGTPPKEDAAMMLQERAYTSPIWYSP